ncbi:dnaJ homolog subfamily C member 7-like isoform X2 [Sitodiplosis mosellana]|uniref:dnaJ homolog subfamily C member 7-like isoform X2 n=1 Tax=Sitodiplosis mosellana TaxID=263140 RepID=UPI002443A820|nr:dnaJ homolog subfamily C member 7-like isoform X2 [Sitodiplosis mosellana]
MYDEAISLWPENVSFYESRIACLMMIGDYKKALGACRSILLFSKGYGYMVKCYVILGDTFAAQDINRKWKEIESENDIIIECKKQCNELIALEKNATKYYNKSNFQKSLEYVDEASKIAHSSIKWKLLRGECLALLGRFEEANNLAVACMQADPSSADAVYIRALCLYEKDWELGLKYFENVLILDPDHKKTIKRILTLRKFKQKDKIGKKLLEEGKYREASENFSQALEIGPVNSTIIQNLLYNRALANSKAGFVRNAINDCTRVVKNSVLYTKVLRLRAKCHFTMGNFQKCIQDFEELLRIKRSADVETMLKEAKNALRRSQSDNYYDILDVPKNATQGEIRRAYLKLAQIHHPDKHSDASNDDKVEQQEVFKKINAAHEVFSGEKSKQLP